MKLVWKILLLVVCCKCTTALYFDLRASNVTDNDPGEPLYLTPLIENGNITEAQEKARVLHPAFDGVESYSGFITINKTYNSNSFFWFFPSRNNPKEDPIMLWFIGGPGLTCLVSIFIHNGPLEFTTRHILQERNHTLNVNHSMIYMDHPVGTGFSFTEHDEGYARNQTHIAEHIGSFLVQFFKLFPQYRKNDFYLGGDSFGGKFVIKSGEVVKKLHDSGEFEFNLKGFILGNGLIDLKYQGLHGEFLYQLGLVDESGREDINHYESEHNDGYNYMTDVTGFVFISNLLYARRVYRKWYQPFVQRPDIRKALHVGNKDANFTSDVVRGFFEPVTVNPVTDIFEGFLRHNYSVLVYNGQLDLLFPYQSNIDYYERLQWHGAQAYKDAERKKLWINGELAGYFKTSGIFHEALIRNAGHVTFYEQPLWSSELVSRFTQHRPLSDKRPIIRPSAFQPTYGIFV